MSWQLLPEVATSSAAITTDKLPNLSCQFFNDGTSKKLYFNINGTIQAINLGDYSTGSTLVIENRTSDPTSPTTGQVWLRTDL